MTSNRNTKAISRSAILAKEPAQAEPGAGSLTVVAFAIATALLGYLGTTLVLASAT